MHKVTINWQIRFFFLILMIFLLLFAKSPFNFLILNTILGYIPIELGFHLQRTNSSKSLFFWLVTIIWLLFYPNAPYLLTDLFHLALLNPHIGNSGLLKSDPTIWFNFSLLLTSALSCTLIAMNQMIDFSIRLKKLWLPKLRFSAWGFIVVMCLLSSIGIYMGRFLRIHSLYILLTPTWFTHQILTMWSMNMVKFTILLTICQLVICWLLYTIRYQAQNATRLR